MIPVTPPPNPTGGLGVRNRGLPKNQVSYLCHWPVSGTECLENFVFITVLFVDYSLFSLQRLLQFFYWNECDTLTLYILLCNRSEEHRTNIFEKEIQCCQQSSQEGVGSRGGEIKAGILDEWNSGGVKAVCHRRGINCGSSVSTIPPGQPCSTEILLQDVECGERHS